jgi:hypothetical protein
MEDRETKQDRETRIDNIVALLASLFDRSGDSIVWIGSGLSIGCGYPGWQEAIEQLCKACIPGKADVQPSSVADDLLEWAERCKETNRVEYHKTLERIYGGPPHLIRTAYVRIGACPFRFLVTTNFDPCLEAVCGSNDPVITYPNLALFRGTHHTCVYLHGKARWGTEPKADNLVLAKSDFAVAYSPGSSLLPGAVEQLLVSHRVLFVGCGLREPVLKQLFRRIKEMQESRTSIPLGKRIILLPDTKDEARAEQEAEHMKSLGIEILRYPLNEDDGPHQPANPHLMLDDVWERVWLQLREKPDPFNQKGGLPS